MAGENRERFSDISNYYYLQIYQLVSPLQSCFWCSTAMSILKLAKSLRSLAEVLSLCRLRSRYLDATQLDQSQTSRLKSSIEVHLTNSKEMPSAEARSKNIVHQLVRTEAQVPVLSEILHHKYSDARHCSARGLTYLNIH